MVDAILPYCGSARCSPINYAFLDGPKAALQADAAWGEGEYATPPERGLRAFARVYVAWAYSHRFFRDGLYRQLGFATLEELVRDWEEDHLKWDANDLIAKIWTWQHGDISDNDRSIAAISSRRFAVDPGSGDRHAVQHRSCISCRGQRDRSRRDARMPSFACSTSPWGHCVGSPGRVPEFQRALDEAAAELLRRMRTMKALVLSSSPRRNGNSALLAEAVSEGLAAAGHETQFVFVDDFLTGFLRDCRECRKPNGECSIEDGFRSIFFDHYLPADGFIAATPIYWYGTSAQLKAFFDRTFCYYAASYPKSEDVIKGMSGKRIGLVLSSEETFPMVSGAVICQIQEFSPLHALDLRRRRARLWQRPRRRPARP